MQSVARHQNHAFREPKDAARRLKPAAEKAQRRVNAIKLEPGPLRGVIPAKARIQRSRADLWIPAFAGMTTTD